ncbi:MAG: hypothetical protein ABFR97_03370 [Thermodesulfobacteriota bacterium]
MANFKSIFSLLLTASLLTILNSGCVVNPNGGSENELAMPVAAVSEQPFYAPSYREIQIPPGFSYDKNKSNFVVTDSFRGGILTYSGRREINSVAEFFRLNMPKHKWQRVYIKTGEPMMQAYVKPKQTCMITISETPLATSIAIYVSDVSKKVGAR